MFLILISEQSRLCHCPFSKEETTLLRGALRQLNWAAGIAGREISVQIYEIGTKIKTAIIAYIITNIHQEQVQVISKHHHLVSILKKLTHVNRKGRGLNVNHLMEVIQA